MHDLCIRHLMQHTLHTTEFAIKAWNLLQMGKPDKLRLLKRLKRHMRSRHAYRGWDCTTAEKKVKADPDVPFSIESDIFLHPTARKKRATASELHIGNEILGSPAEHITVCHLGPHSYFPVSSAFFPLWFSEIIMSFLLSSSPTCC